MVGGLAAITDQIDNYPGFAHGVKGLELSDQLRAQAERFGAEIELATVVSIRPTADSLFAVELGDGGVRLTQSVLIGSGSEWKKLGIPGENEFYGRGIHNCATCDGAFYRGRRLVTVGGGNSSAQESLFLTKFASQIDIMIRGEAWKASDVLVRQIEKHPKITVHFGHRVVEVVGKQQNGHSLLGHLQVDTGSEVVRWDTAGLFVFIGLRPVTDYLQESGVVLDQSGFVVTDGKLRTNLDGVFAAGDVRSGATMQIASAVGEGASAALSIRHFLESRLATQENQDQLT